MLVNNSLLNRQPGQLKQVNRKVEAVSQAVSNINEEIAEREVAISTTISLTNGLYCTGDGTNDSPFVLGFLSDDYDNACTRLSALFNTYTGNLFENVDIDIGLLNSDIRYDIKAANRIGYFISGDDSPQDEVDGVDTYAEADFISIDAIPIQPTMRAASNNNGTVVSFALEKNAEDTWETASSHPVLIKQADNGKYYDCFISSFSDNNGLTRVNPDIVGWIPEIMSASPLDIKYSIHGLNI